MAAPESGAKPGLRAGKSPQSGDGYRGPERTGGLFQSDKLRIDPLANWYFTDADRLEKRVAVLLRLRPGVRPRDLVKPPAGLDLSLKAWRASLAISPAYTEGPIANILEHTGFCTGFASGAFFQLLVNHSVLQQLVEGITLSSSPAVHRSVVRKAPEAGVKAQKMASALAGAKVVLGVIDDKVGVANQRFRLASGDTRCLSLWLQDVDGVGSPPPLHGYGRELKAGQINALLGTAGSDEDHFERSLSAPLDVRPSQRISHGTHVADVFAGYGHDTAAEKKKGASMPMICVALPRDALSDTSGLPLIKPVIDAIIHTIETVTLLGGSNPPPIVINYSVGVLADISYLLSDMRDKITALMDAYNQAHPTAPLVIVTAAGNSFQTQGHACLPRQSGPISQRWDLDLRVLPDDRSLSYITFELPAGASAYKLTVTPPGLPSTTVDTVTTYRDLQDLQGRKIGSLQLIPPLLPQHPQGTFTVILHPTADPLDGSSNVIAPHGIWRLQVGGLATSNGKSVHVFIARDVTLPGFKSYGRQSRFEDKNYLRYGRYGRPGDTDEPSSAIKRGGAVNVLGNSMVKGPVSVAARVARTDRPADYSSAGYELPPQQPTQIRGPDVICDAEHSEVVMGLLATGIRTGSVVAMNGTSVAAPLAARAIADALSAGTVVFPPDANAGRVIAESLVLLPLPQVDARRGHGLIPMAGQRNLRLAQLRDR